MALISTLSTLTPNITCIAYHNNLLYVASVNQVNVYDLSDYSLIDTFKTNDSSSGSVKSIAFSDSKIFTAHQDRRIRVWKITRSKTHRLVSTLPTVKDRLRHFVLPRNYVHVRRHKKQLWIEHGDAVSGIVVNDDLVYSVSWDKSFKIWDASDHKCLESVKAHDDAVNAIVVSDNGVVYTGSADGLIRIWERENDYSRERRRHSLVTTLEKHKSAVNSLTLNVDGSVLSSGGVDRSIVVWERSSGGEKESRAGDYYQYMVFVEALLGHEGAVLCLINVKEFLVSGSTDRTVRIWQRGMHNGYKCMMVLDGHEKPVKSLTAVTVGGSKRNGDVVSVCSASLDGEVRLWEVPSLNFKCLNI